MNKPRLSPSHLDEVIKYLREQGQLEITGQALPRDDYLEKVGIAAAIELLRTLKDELQTSDV